jgi:hypothetical protein
MGPRWFRPGASRALLAPASHAPPRCPAWKMAWGCVSTGRCLFIDTYPPGPAPARLWPLRDINTAPTAPASDMRRGPSPPWHACPWLAGWLTVARPSFLTVVRCCLHDVPHAQCDAPPPHGAEGGRRERSSVGAPSTCLRPLAPGCGGAAQAAGRLAKRLWSEGWKVSRLSSQ